MLYDIQNKILIIEILSTFTLAIVFIIGLYTIKDNFETPLSRLYQASVDVSSGKYDIQIPENYDDNTMQLLSETFNNMTKSISDMIEKEKEISQYKILLEQANFLALQTQVNPHFLFNTLNSISRTIILKKDNDAIKMINSLATLLRYNLQDANISASLYEELQIVSQYLNIQQYRFQDRIKSEFNYDAEKSKMIYLPRFTLQPIVENAIIHGLEPKLSSGLIKIDVRFDINNCIILIQDDGVGIEPEKLALLLTGNSKSRVGHTTSIGIHNTMKRLEIFTHNKDSFKIENIPSGGTSVIIKIPCPLELQEDIKEHKKNV